MINVEYNLNPDGTYRGVPNTPAQPPRNRRGLKVALVTLGVILAVSLCVGGGYLAGLHSHNTDNPTATPTMPASSPIIQTGNPTPGPTDITTDIVAPGGSMTVAQVAESCVDSVVMVNTEAVVTGNWNQSYIRSGAGSGVIVGAEGTIITNHHVVDGADTITVTLTDGTTFPAILVASDAIADIAVIRIDPEDTALTVATVGKTSEVNLGEPVVVIGNPMGLGSTVTDGIVSALSRAITIDGIPMTLMQTNAEINPGNSGGGLFNTYGRLIGIVNAKASDTDIEGIGFAIPIDYAVEIANQLIDKGYVSGRAVMNVQFLEITDYRSAIMYKVNRYGVYVYSIPESEDTELQVGDYIVSIDDKNISTVSDIKALLMGHNAGDQVTVEVIRDENRLKLTITLAEDTPNT